MAPLTLALAMLAFGPAGVVESYDTPDTIDLRLNDIEGEEVGSLAIWLDGTTTHVLASSADGGYADLAIDDQGQIVFVDVARTDGLETTTSALLDYLGQDLSAAKRRPPWWKCAGLGGITTGLCVTEVLGPGACALGAAKTACACLEWAGQKPPVFCEVLP